MSNVSVLETNTGISDIERNFSITQIDELREGLGLVAQALPDDNLTQWSKENGQFAYTTRAVTLNALATGLHYAVSSQEKYLDKLSDDLDQHYKVNDGTEFWNTKGESLLERVAVCEHNLDGLEQVFAIVKDLYENASGDAWKPYTAPSKTATQTATAADVAETLLRLKKRVA
jgi:hypothetical protein